MLNWLSFCGKNKFLCGRKRKRAQNIMASYLGNFAGDEMEIEGLGEILKNIDKDEDSYNNISQYMNSGNSLNSKNKYSIYSVRNNIEVISIDENLQTNSPETEKHIITITNLKLIELLNDIQINFFKKIRAVYRVKSDSKNYPEIKFEYFRTLMR
jgi:hypothetical protein